MSFQRSCFVAAGVILLAAAGLAIQACAPVPPGPPPGVAGDVPLPPPVMFPAPPQLVVVPGTNVYVAPDVQVDIVFHQGYWWRPYGGRWYRSHSYGGPWSHVGHERVPPVIVGLPPGYRHRYMNQPRIHHEEVHRNWERWERERYWEGRRHNW